MAPNRFRRDVREKRESTPFAEDPNAVTSIYQNHIPLNTSPPEIPAEWRDIEAPINFTWVCQDELAGMGWPKSRDQVRFLVQQGIDHLVTLSSDKLPPHYAFPDLKWTMIPVEDFTGPTIAEIKKFIGIMDDARKEGEVRIVKTMSLIHLCVAVELCEYKGMFRPAKQRFSPYLTYLLFKEGLTKSKVLTIEFQSSRHSYAKFMSLLYI